MIEWFRGVPWVKPVLTAAHQSGVAEAVTEVARGLIEAARHDPTRVTARRSVRGRFVAIISDELVVTGFEVGAMREQPVVEDAPAKIKGRGPRSQDELIEWLADEGYPVVLAKAGHLAVLGPNGQRLVTMANTPSDHRALANNVANCRRVLGISLRRQR